MACIVDIQCFRIGEEKGSIQWAVKEMAVYDGKESYHYLFKPPFPFNCLSESLKREANWNMKNHHGLPWDEGTESLEDLPAILDAATTEIIYVKGRQKAQFLRQLYTKKPILELLERPKLRRMVPECWYHNLDNCACALSNVYSLYKIYFEK